MKPAVAPVLMALAAVISVATGTSALAATESTMALASHRAVYDLKLASTRGKRPIQSVRGRILYDFSGSACEGYALRFRQVSELSSGEGPPVVSDLRATTWEQGEAKRLTFDSQNYLDDRPRDTVNGAADRANAGIVVRLERPRRKSFDVTVDVAFPTEHVRRIIAAAKAGRTLFEIPVYDGAENGEKIYDTLTVIGRPIEADASRPADAASRDAAMAQIVRWPVTISYFDRSAANSGEQTPLYSITFELYENGVSRALLLDYNDFVLSGEMTSLEIKPAKPCP